jgi:hypothetical protein
MTATNSQTQADNLDLGVDIAPDSGLANVTNALALLLERAEENLTPQELNWLSDGIADTVQGELDNLHSVVNGIAGLVSCDERAGNFRGTESVSSLMWSVAHQLDVIRGLSALSRDAQTFGELRKHTDKQA